MTMQDYAISRSAMIETQLVARGIRDARILEAFRSIPREKFVDHQQRELAYADCPLPIADGQKISQPYIVALMLNAAEIKPSDRVLEVGAGSGYAAALLGRLAHRVWTLERHQQLARFAGARIAELGLANVTVLRTDGALGWRHAAPFDAIIVSAGAAEIPGPLMQQLAIGGRLIMPVGPDENSQHLRKITRLEDATFAEENLGPVSFVPLVSAQDAREPHHASPKAQVAVEPRD